MPAVTKYPCAAAKQYFGRGPIQLSWNYNYKDFGKAVNLDLVASPELVATDFDMVVGLPGGFAKATHIVNGGLECGVNPPNRDSEKSRIASFKKFCELLGVAPGDNLACQTADFNIPPTSKRQRTPKNDRGRVTRSRSREDAPLSAPLRTRSDLPDDDSHLLSTSGNRHVGGFYTPTTTRGTRAVAAFVSAAAPPTTEADDASVPLPDDNNPLDVRDGTHIGSDDGYGRTAPQVWNAPALPQPPTYSGSTKAERRAFMREYQNYLAFEEGPQDLDVLKQRLQQAIRFDTKILDAESRVGRMLDELMRSLEQHHQDIEAGTLHEAASLIYQDVTAVAKNAARTMERRRKGRNDRAQECRPFARKGCLKCGDMSHRVARCPKTAAGEAETLLAAQVKRWKDCIKVLVNQPQRQKTERGVLLENIVRVDDVLLDSGSDVTVVTRGVMDALDAAGVKVGTVSHSVQHMAYPYGSDAKPVVMTRSVDDASTATELVVSRPVMELLGFSVEDLLYGMANVKRLMAEKLNPSEHYPDDVMECATPETRGLAPAEATRLHDLLAEHIDVFREDLGDDPPVKVEPLKVRIKPGSTPVKCGMQRYPPLYVEYMRSHVVALEANGIVYKNNRATWAATPRIVPKKEVGDLRMTIDSRPINACTEPMPNLDSAMVCLVGTNMYFNLDWTKGYSQLPLHANSQLRTLSRTASRLPTKCLRYPPLYVEYMRSHVVALEANGIVYKNNRATWAATPRIVPKKEVGDLRMTIDSRPINACTEPMPNLDSAMVCLVGTNMYFNLDWTKGYSQLPLHANSQL
ncbi:hypothetical protein H257_18058 [Aphanomyces astaci]|uniref:Glycoside hydrolase family 19 catalytic domain-containing protein n=1 Tax=Aphanomyces astaci TaxID=112090 RepID=W4FEJ5_APHAT|nr:hypothetical protein H257_18058 [Aphanomyces astaci]ETV65133.1 hypothetical protein H257_18058 [Aphanomyces astaci]|eukprot:XP_009845371.1 hypothetical protein H257_18058 [Aphanomyces astaci]